MILRSTTFSLVCAILCMIGCVLWIMQAIQTAKENQE